MAIKMLTHLSQIDKTVKEWSQQNEITMADELCDIGRQCVQIAKDLPQGGSRQPYPAPYQYLGDTRPNYTDWTKNLRNSIGWAVLRNGAIYKKDIGSIQNTEAYLTELVRDYQTGIVLLVMATGEDPRNSGSYAYYVQALGYDVLKTSQLRGYEIAKSMLNKLFNALN